MSAHNIVQLTNASCWSTTHGGKKVRWPVVTPTIGRLTSYLPNVFPLVDVRSLGYGQIYNILSNDQIYDVTIRNFLRCSCVYFVQNVGKFFGCLWGVCAL
jgi:hypothetical protein